MTEENTNVEVTETPIKAVVSNIVTMENGENIDFGKSGKIKASYDVATSTITFKTVVGSIINYVVDGLDNLSDFQKEVYLYGVMEKIKSTLAPTKIEDLEAKINKQIEEVKSGVFTTRTMDSTVELSDFLKAFAIINATQRLFTPMGYVDVAMPVEALKVTELQPHWVNVNNSEVIKEVSDFWTALPKGEKSAQRGNSFVKAQLSFIENNLVTL